MVWDQRDDLPPSSPRAECPVDEGILAPSRRQTATVHGENEVSEELSLPGREPPHQQWPRYIGMRRDVLTDAAFFRPIIHEAKVKIIRVDAPEREDVCMGKFHPYWDSFPQSLSMWFEDGPPATLSACSPPLFLPSLARNGSEGL